MRKYISKYLLLSILFILASTFSFSQAQAFIKKYQKISDSLSREFGIPSSIILAVAIVESESGKSRNSKLLNNYFGIIGKNNLRAQYKIKTRYKQYSDSVGSFIDFCKLIQKKNYYTHLKGNNDYNKWVKAISKNGYSEFPKEWSSRVLLTIKKYKL